MTIPQILVDTVIQGRAVLFLGAGASRGAIHPQSIPTPIGNQLRDRISTHFLEGKFHDSDLQFVGDLAISAAGLFRVQEFIKGVYEGYQPAPFHNLIPRFKWKGLVSTNYDLILERAYANEGALQKIIPIISNNEPIFDYVRELDSVVYLKLHGCITRIRDENTPLILSGDQYIDYNKNRNRVFGIFEGWAGESQVIFAGYSIKDQNIRAILKSIESLGEMRPRSYIVTPGMQEEERRMWEQKKFTVIDLTFEDFLRQLDSRISTSARSLSIIQNMTHPIERKLEITGKIDPEVVSFLTSDFEYIHSEIESGAHDAQKFYKGFDLGWFPIVNDMDVSRRTITSFTENRLAQELDNTNRPSLFCVKAEAGAGKSIALKRMAWDLSQKYDAVCIFKREEGKVLVRDIINLQSICNSRVFVFIDEALDHVNEIESLILAARKSNVAITIVVAARNNEWNMYGEKLDQYLTDSVELNKLSEKETDQLIDLLEKYNSLGRLSEMSRAEQKEQFVERAGRQLLVALHEATQGKRFEDILIDEFNTIVPERAKDLYLGVCILNRLNIKVRAGLISRVYGIQFLEFEDSLHKPLDHVVRVVPHNLTNDQMYVARHHEIAQIVFEKILVDEEDRLDEYLRIIPQLNTLFDTDLEAFRELIKHRSLTTVFHDHEKIREIYKAAETLMPNDYYVNHQRGLYELYRTSGSLDAAQGFFEKSLEIRPNNRTVEHSLAELYLRRSNLSPNPTRKAEYRDKCEKVCLGLLTFVGSRKVARHTLIKMELDKLRDIFAEDDSTDRDIQKQVQNVQEQLAKAKQEYPSDSMILKSDSDFLRLIEDYPRASRALEKAFAANPRNTAIAVSLSKEKVNSLDLLGSKEILLKALSVNRGSQKLNFEYAMLLKAINPHDSENILYHLRRSFSPGDKSYESQFWFACYAYQSEDPELRKEAEDIFESLRSAPMNLGAKRSIREVATKDGAARRYFGRITKKNPSYGFITKDEFGQTIFFHKDQLFKDLTWQDLEVGARISMEIGFAFEGPRAMSIRNAFS